ncbi:MAG: hypothetical protein P4L43_19810 [Syntrophobacteraceae bacterium]|nr:hypothetical protein [Syntrophobacteraceae bacterium]
MIENTLIILSINVISLMGIIYLLLWLYKDYATDSFRQRMFALRDRLFDDAAQGFVAFDHPSYGLLRGTMNGYIRFGHRLSLLETITLIIFIRNEADTISVKYTFEKRWKVATAGMSPHHAVERLNDYRSDMNRLVLKHLIFGSPLFLALLGFIGMILIPYMIQQQILRFIERTLRLPLMGIESAAMAEGEW